MGRVMKEERESTDPSLKHLHMTKLACFLSPLNLSIMKPTSTPQCEGVVVCFFVTLHTLLNLERASEIPLSHRIECEPLSSILITTALECE